MAELRRRHIAWNICQNPTEITIHRVEKIRDRGGFEERETTIPPITVRIFITRSQIPQTVSILSGTKQTDVVYSLLADEHADIRADTQTTDTFITNGQRFEVIAVHPQVVAGETVGYQADLERVM